MAHLASKLEGIPYSISPSWNGEVLDDDSVTGLSKQTC